MLGTAQYLQSSLRGTYLATQYTGRCMLLHSAIPVGGLITDELLSAGQRYLSYWPRTVETPLGWRLHCSQADR